MTSNKNKKNYKYAVGLYFQDNVSLSHKFETLEQAKRYTVKLYNLISGEGEDFIMKYNISGYDELCIFKKEKQGYWKIILFYTTKFEKYESTPMKIEIKNMSFPKKLPIKSNMFMIGAFDDKITGAWAYRRFYKTLRGAIDGSILLAIELNKKPESILEKSNLYDEIAILITKTNKKAIHSDDYLGIGSYSLYEKKFEWNYYKHNHRVLTKDEKDMIKTLLYNL